MFQQFEDNTTYPELTWHSYLANGGDLVLFAQVVAGDSNGSVELLS